jgi:hypothetical protein
VNGTIQVIKTISFSLQTIIHNTNSEPACFHARLPIRSMFTNFTHFQHEQQRQQYQQQQQQQQQQQAPEEKKRKVKGLQAAPLNQVISSLRAFQESLSLSLSLSLSQSCKGLQNQSIIPNSFSARWSARPRPNTMTLGERKEKEASLNPRTIPMNEFWWNWLFRPDNARCPSCYSCRVGRLGVCSPSKFFGVG